MNVKEGAKLEAHACLYWPTTRDFLEGHSSALRLSYYLQYFLMKNEKCRRLEKASYRQIERILYQQAMYHNVQRTVDAIENRLIEVMPNDDPAKFPCPLNSRLIII